jgi:iron(III) transport system substrate-binding protein
MILASSRIANAVLGCLFGLLLVGCGASTPPEVVVYTALDEEFSRPIFSGFERRNNVTVRPKFDTEATKTVGLAVALIAERDRPRCDLFWNNEVLHTIRLEQAGLLSPHTSQHITDYPAAMRGKENSWIGFAARGRVLIINNNLLSEARRPESIEELTDPQWRDQCGVAKPLFGTSATHAACLFAAWGEERAKEFYVGVKKNCRIMSGNKGVAQAVAQGRLMFGLTDTDDAMIELESGRPVTIVYPDQGEGQVGTLFIPNTLALINGSPNPEAGAALADYLLSPEVEGRLVDGPSAQIPLNGKSTAKPRVETPSTVRAMDIDFYQAAEQWAVAAEFLKNEFTAAE